jgi:hypothetical protein
LHTTWAGRTILGPKSANRNVIGPHAPYPLVSSGSLIHYLGMQPDGAVDCGSAGLGNVANDILPRSCRRFVLKPFCFLSLITRQIPFYGRHVRWKEEAARADQAENSLEPYCASQGTQLLQWWQSNSGSIEEACWPLCGAKLRQRVEPKAC